MLPRPSVAQGALKARPPLLGFAVSAPPPPLPVAEDPFTTLDVPTALVASGVTSYRLASPKLFWQSEAVCPPPPSHIVASDVEPQAAGDPETTSRMPGSGGTIRTLFSKNDARPSGGCNPYDVRSNIVADGSFAYRVDNTGLMNLSVEANLGDPPPRVSAIVSNTGASEDSTPIELANDSANLSALTDNSSQVPRPSFAGW